MTQVNQTMDHGVLAFFNPKGVGSDPPSKTVKSVTLQVYGGEDTLTLPVYTNTKVLEVKFILAQKLRVDPYDLSFTYKQGSHYRANYDHEEINRKVMVHGVKAFSRQRASWPFPHAVIGAGHIGLKCAMTWLQDKFTDFVIFDRKPEVGGTSWWDQANATSRLQTEVGVYHLEYHENNGWPEDASTNPWPSRGQLLKHFHDVSEQFGILPYCRLSTSVTKVDILGKDYWSQQYELRLESSGEESTFQCSSVMLFPGNLTNPKRVIYKGEELFDGDVVYGISSAFDYSKCTGKIVSIVGSGAFSVENVRTCVEFACQKIHMICRRKTIAMPRIVSWFINQSENFISAALTLDMSSPMYDLIGVDQWKYYAVYANEARTNVTIRQKSRFGIGDVYFLAMYFGACEHHVDDIKRLSHHKIHLISGQYIDDVEFMLKLLGFNGEFENDRLMKLKELYGWWVNKDLRRYIVAEPLGVDANNFGGTSFSPGAIIWSEQQIFLLYYPADWAPVMEGNQMPTHVADESVDRPAYVVEARHGALTGITLGSIVPGIGERGNVTGPLKRQRMWQIHPADKFLECCKKEWFHWADIMKKNGYEKPIPDYPYNLELVEEYLEKEAEANREANAAMARRFARMAEGA